MGAQHDLTWFPYARTGYAHEEFHGEPRQHLAGRFPNGEQPDRVPA
jgi:hypothetical protein